MKILEKINALQNPPRNLTKSRMNVTLDTELILRINEFKKKHNIGKLSPLVNLMLWDFIENIVNRIKIKEQSTLKDGGNEDAD